MKNTIILSIVAALPMLAQCPCGQPQGAPAPQVAAAPCHPCVNPQVVEAIKAKIMEKYDADKNGQLSDEEKAVAAKDFEAMKNAAKVKFMERFDTDKDGKLSDAEKAEVKKVWNEKKAEWMAKHAPKAQKKSCCGKPECKCAKPAMHKPCCGQKPGMQPRHHGKPVCGMMGGKPQFRHHMGMHKHHMGMHKPCCGQKPAMHHRHHGKPVCGMMGGKPQFRHHMGMHKHHMGMHKPCCGQKPGMQPRHHGKPVCSMMGGKPQFRHHMGMHKHHMGMHKPQFAMHRHHMGMHKPVMMHSCAMISFAKPAMQGCKCGKPACKCGKPGCGQKPAMQPRHHGKPVCGMMGGKPQFRHHMGMHKPMMMHKAMPFAKPAMQGCKCGKPACKCGKPGCGQKPAMQPRHHGKPVCGMMGGKPQFRHHMGMHKPMMMHKAMPFAKPAMQGCKCAKPACKCGKPGCGKPAAPVAAPAPQGGPTCGIVPGACGHKNLTEEQKQALKAKFMEKFDADKDGKLSDEEKMAAAKFFAARGAAKGNRSHGMKGCPNKPMGARPVPGYQPHKPACSRCHKPAAPAPASEAPAAPAPAEQPAA